MPSEDKTEAFIPVRTRGAIRQPESAAISQAAPSPVITRGAVRTRGAAAPAAGPSETGLEQLVRDLRKTVGGLPLTTVVYGWPDPRSKAFLDALTPFQDGRDAVWVVRGEDAGESAELTERAARVLDLQQDMDRRIYSNMITDILYFPATRKVQTADVSMWKRRARVLIVDREAPEAVSVANAGRDASIVTYRRLGANGLEEWEMPV